MNPLILDTDGGVDDAQALVMLLAHDRRPMAITTVFGNVPLPLATRNMLATLSHCSATEIPVIPGADRPLVQEMVNATDIHGDDGLGGAALPETLPAPDDSRHAVTYLIDTLTAATRDGRQIDLLMIGPLTNLALALRLAPEIVKGIGQVTIMGATIYGRGNTTPAAEFNIYADPEAADVVLSADIPTVIVPWEPCKSHALTGAQMDAITEPLTDDDLGTFNRSLAAHSRAINESYTGVDEFRFVDPFAAAVVIEPGIVTKSIEASMAVSLAPGITRGMTLVDPSGRLGTPPVTLVEAGDLNRLAALFKSSLEWRPALQTA